MKKLELLNKKFSRLTVISQEPFRKGISYWLCRCDCGKTIIAQGRSLVSGNTKSCGCLQIENATRASKEKCTTHGLSRTRPYRIWIEMLRRCQDKKRPEYPRYGGRGIKVCERWLKFENFWEDMKIGYSDKLTIDRIDNDNNYELGNCRWATYLKQNNNRSNNVKILFRNQYKTIAELAREFKMTHKLLSRRLIIGWNIEKALTLPSRKHHGNTN